MNEIPTKIPKIVQRKLERTHYCGTCTYFDQGIVPQSKKFDGVCSYEQGFAPKGAHETCIYYEINHNKIRQEIWLWNLRRQINALEKIIREFSYLCAAYKMPNADRRDLREKVTQFEEMKYTLEKIRNELWYTRLDEITSEYCAKVIAVIKRVGRKSEALLRKCDTKAFKEQ